MSWPSKPTGDSDQGYLVPGSLDPNALQPFRCSANREQTSPSLVARQPDFKRRWRRSGEYTPPRRVSCADLPRQTYRHKKFTRPCQWRVPKWLDRFDPRNMTQSSRGLRPFRNRCLQTIAPRTENECRTGQDSGRSRGSRTVAVNPLVR